LLRVAERGGVKILEVYTDTFAAPLNLAQIRGKRVVMEREFTPYLRSNMRWKTPPIDTSPCRDLCFKQFEHCHTGDAYCHYWALDSFTYLDTVIAPLATIYLDNATGPKIRYINVEGFAYNSMYDSRSSLLDYLRGMTPSIRPVGFTTMLKYMWGSWTN
jgi:hypothetical protein